VLAVATKTIVLEDLAGGAVAVAGTMSPESAYSSLLDGSSTTGFAFANDV